MERFRSFSAIIPLILNQWTPVHISKEPFQPFQEKNAGWEVVTKSSASGYLYFLPEAVALTESGPRISWRWSVTRFPACRLEDRFKKNGDDYALRVGILIDDGETRSRAVEVIAKKKVPVSLVVFYDAIGSGIDSAGSTPCAINPSQNRVLDCLLSESEGRPSMNPYLVIRKYFKLDEQEARKLRVMGFWIHADSDDTHSESRAQLSELKIQ